jgi:hypothetical protein
MDARHGSGVKLAAGDLGLNLLADLGEIGIVHLYGAAFIEALEEEGFELGVVGLLGVGLDEGLDVLLDGGMAGFGVAGVGPAEKRGDAKGERGVLGRVGRRLNGS